MAPRGHSLRNLPTRDAVLVKTLEPFAGQFPFLQALFLADCLCWSGEGLCSRAGGNMVLPHRGSRQSARLPFIIQVASNGEAVVSLRIKIIAVTSCLIPTHTTERVPDALRRANLRRAVFMNTRRGIQQDPRPACKNRRKERKLSKYTTRVAPMKFCHKLMLAHFRVTVSNPPQRMRYLCMMQGGPSHLGKLV